MSLHDLVTIARHILYVYVLQMSFDIFQLLTYASGAKKCQSCIRDCIFLPCMTRPLATLAFEISEKGNVDIYIVSGSKEDIIAKYIVSDIHGRNSKGLSHHKTSVFNPIRQSPSKATISSTRKEGPASMDASHLNLASLSLHLFTVVLKRARQKVGHVQSVLICAPSLVQFLGANDGFIQSSAHATNNGKNVIHGIQYSKNKGPESFSCGEATYIFDFRAQAPVRPLIRTLDPTSVSYAIGPGAFALILSSKMIENNASDCYVNIITNTLGVCRESLRLVGQVQLQAEIHQRNQEVIVCHASTPSASPSINLLMKVTDMERRNKIDTTCYGKIKCFERQSRVINVLRKKPASPRETCILWRKEICIETRRTANDKLYMRPRIDGAGYIITGGLGGIGGLICQITPKGSVVISRRGFSSNSRICNLNFISIHK